MAQTRQEQTAEAFKVRKAHASKHHDTFWTNGQEIFSYDLRLAHWENNEIVFDYEEWRRKAKNKDDRYSKTTNSHINILHEYCPKEGTLEKIAA